MLRFVVGGGLLGAPTACAPAVETCPPIAYPTCNCAFDEGLVGAWPFIAFAPGSAQLSPEGERALTQMIRNASSMDDVIRLRLVAYDDGEETFDRPLAQARGEVLAVYITSLGVPSQLIEQTPSHAVEDARERASTAQVVFALRR